MKKLAILVPGAGYHTDKPLLYHASELVAEHDYEFIRLHFDGLPTGIKGDPQKMGQVFEMVVKQGDEQLAGIRFDEYDDVIFISKSVGTCVAVHYNLMHPELKARHVLLTPLMQTVTHGRVEGIAFHGTADDWAPTDELARCCEEYKIPLYNYPDANHSLEVGNVQRDLDILKDVMLKIEEYLN